MNPIPLLRRAALALCGLALVWTASPVQAQTDPPTRVVRVAYAWCVSGTGRKVEGRALNWWLDQLRHRNTRQALLENHHRN